jgi:hypothetical protein
MSSEVLKNNCLYPCIFIHQDNYIVKPVDHPQGLVVLPGGTVHEQRGNSQVLVGSFFP